MNLWQMQPKRLKFTFVEVLAAVALLAVGLSAVMTLLAVSTQRLQRSRDVWYHQHALALATEYFLLAGPNSPLPMHVFPYSEIEVNCVMEYPDNIPGEVELSNAQWHLRTLKIELHFPGGGLEAIRVDSIIHDTQM